MQVLERHERIMTNCATMRYLLLLMHLLHLVCLVCSWTTMISSPRFRGKSRSQESPLFVASAHVENATTTIDALQVNENSPIQKTDTLRTTTIHRLPNVRKVHCISDLHVDHPDNMKWLEEKCRSVSKKKSNTNGVPTTIATTGSWDETDLIVVAGDISHVMCKIEVSLKLLLGTGAHVVFVPGNHEAWMEEMPDDMDNDSDKHQQTSIHKLEAIEELCQNLGVYTTGDCVCVGGGADKNNANNTDTGEELWILPLDSWYDGSLSIIDLDTRNIDDEASSLSFVPPPHYDLVRDFGKFPWVDFIRCKWPTRFYHDDNKEQQQQNHQQDGTIPRSQLLRKIPGELVDYYLQKNQRIIDTFRNSIASNTPPRRTSLLTITHFLPNQQSLPDWKNLSASTFCCDSWLDHGAGGISAKFALVAGSDKIDAQIRAIGAASCNGNITIDQQLHVFGHSHRPKDFVFRDIRYVHNPLGKPREREMFMVDPEVDTQLLWEADNAFDETTHVPLLRYWEERGGGLVALRNRMLAKKRARKKRLSAFKSTSKN